MPSGGSGPPQPSRCSAFSHGCSILAGNLGVSYPPILAIVLGFGLLLLKILTMDLERSRQERLIRRWHNGWPCWKRKRPLLLEAPLPPGGTGGKERRGRHGTGTCGNPSASSAQRERDRE
jgi:hypothetical protein